MKMAMANPDFRKDERGMTLVAVMAMMVLFTVALLAVAPSVHQEVQREKELESIRRGEEIADAIRQYVVFHRGTKLPESIDDLLEGLPQGTKKRMILRGSAATDPLSEDGKWRLIKPDPQTIAAFAKRVQAFNNGVLPGTGGSQQEIQYFNKYSVLIVNNSVTGSEDDSDIVDDAFDVVTDNQPFIGVASQSRSKSILAYYGIEKHSNWIFTPLFRGNSVGINQTFRPTRPPRPSRLGDN
jgi:type II secretory pathway pseudopilin PulG